MPEQDTENTEDEPTVEVLHEWTKLSNDPGVRERYRLVRRGDAGKVLYRRREQKHDGEWEAKPVRSRMWDDKPDEETPDHILNGWEDVPAEFHEVSPDAGW